MLTASEFVLQLISVVLYNVFDSTWACIYLFLMMCWQHLNAVLPDNEDYEEMTCAGCMEKHSFLWAYQVTSQGHYWFLNTILVTSPCHKLTCHSVRSPVQVIMDSPCYQVTSPCHRHTCHAIKLPVQAIMDSPCYQVTSPGHYGLTMLSGHQSMP